MALVLTIAGSTQQLRAGSLRISQTANGRATASFTIVSTAGTYRPAIDAEVIITEDGTRIFGGLAQRLGETGLFENGAMVGIATTVSAVDFNAYADRRAVNGIMPAGTMKAHLTVLLNSLVQFGVTLSGSQVDGPMLPELVHEYVKLSDVLNEIAMHTAAHGEPYIWRISNTKVLSMYPPGGAGGGQFSGSEAQYFIQQAELYRWVSEGDARLHTFFYNATLTSYQAIFDTIATDLSNIVNTLEQDETEAFLAGAIAAEAAGFFSGTANQFLIQQAEYYRWLPEGDERFFTFFYPDTLVTYNALIGTIEDALADLLDDMLVDERLAIDTAYTSHTSGIESAPFHIVGNTSEYVLGDIEVETSREHYANSIIVLVPSKTETNRTETFTGDGTTATFALNYHIDTNRGGVTSAGAFETLGTGATWSYDAVANTITRTSAPAAGAPISIVFDGTLATFGLASDAGEIAAVGYWEKVIRVENVPSAAAAQARAEAELASALAVHETARYRTMASGLWPGQTQTVTVPKRDIDATGLISDVTIRDFGKDRLLREVTVLIDESQTNLSKGWRDVYKKWSGDTTGKGSAVVTSPTTPPAQGGPGGPNDSVQRNANGVFGGDAEFTYNATTNSLVCGALCSITAGAPESCAVFGYDGHIADP